MCQIKVEGVHPVVYEEYINIYYHQNTTNSCVLKVILIYKYAITKRLQEEYTWVVYEMLSLKVK
jgi:hypothetical protein